MKTVVIDPTITVEKREIVFNNCKLCGKEPEVMIYLHDDNWRKKGLVGCADCDVVVGFDGGTQAHQQKFKPDGYMYYKLAAKWNKLNS